MLFSAAIRELYKQHCHMMNGRVKDDLGCPSFLGIHNLEHEKKTQTSGKSVAGLADYFQES